jgi:hypothetical protein
MAAPNLYPTTTPSANPFILQTQGWIQGLSIDDPVSRMWLVTGTLISSAAVVMWGGRPITEQIDVNTGTQSSADGLGPVVLDPTTQAGVTGFAVFNQQMHMTIAPNQPVPIAGPTNGIGFFRLNTQARIPVACDPALITTIAGGGFNIGQEALQWDPVNYRVTLTTGGSIFALPTTIKLLAVNQNSKIITYNAGTALASWANGSAALLLI